MDRETEVKNKTKTLVIFLPFDIKNIYRSFLYGDIEDFNGDVKIFFTRNILHDDRTKSYQDIFGDCKPFSSGCRSKLEKDYIFIESTAGILSIKQIKISGEYVNPNRYEFLCIGYNFKLFVLCENYASDEANIYGKFSYFKRLKCKVRDEINKEKKRKAFNVSEIMNVLLLYLSVILTKLTNFSINLLPVTKYLNIAIHINNYLRAFSWAVQSVIDKKKLDIKVTNFLWSVFLDMILGIFLLNWLNSKVSLDSSVTIFLQTAESVVNSFNYLINWLKGDPAGLKLNWAFNKILATFFSFHIEIWWNFLVYIKPVVKIIFHIFLKLGLLGITFQASITADLLALVSFHVYCLHAYAAKLYNIQISSLISLWRLFLGRKNNPLRGKVDSCMYSPKQLFVGTLAFTILLFLLPTTLLYYVVFTSIKLFILVIGRLLIVVQYLNQTLPVYTTALWLTKSPKIFLDIEIEECKYVSTYNFIFLNVKPKMCGWFETVFSFTPDCAVRPKVFDIFAFLKAALTGRHIMPLSRP